jgi:probable phosphoglycerate mutase
LYLVRHAAHRLVDHVLVGRLPNVSLSPEGIGQAKRLASWFAGRDIAVVHSSPRERACETAAAIAAASGVECSIAPALDEIEFGEWSGMSFEALSKDDRWHSWNSSRSSARPPGGETMIEAQLRIVSHLQRVAELLPRGCAVLVSHCDVIKAALLHVLGRPVDSYAEFDIAPGSVSTVRLANRGAEVLALNEREAA